MVKALGANHYVATPSFRFTTSTPFVLVYWSPLYSIHGLGFLKKSSLPMRESWIRGSSIVRPRSMGRVVWAVQDQAKDYPSCPDGTSQYVGGKIRVHKFPSLMNRSCTNPRPHRCVYKLEGLDCRGHLHYHHWNTHSLDI